MDSWFDDTLWRVDDGRRATVAATVVFVLCSKTEEFGWLSC